MTGTELISKIYSGIRLLDGATGTALIAAGMKINCCKEAWILEHPEVIRGLQRKYADAGSQIIYAPTFQANPLALARYGLEAETEEFNVRLVELSREAAPECIIAGDVTTLRMHVDTSDTGNRGIIEEAYRRQIRGLVKGGADIIVAETLMHPIEAETVLKIAGEEGAGAVMITFPVKADGTLYSGHDGAETIARLEKLGAAAVGVNCVAASESLPDIVAAMIGKIDIPFICKPNAGRAMNGIYPVGPDDFAQIMYECMQRGAQLIGGCCGTDPDYIAKLKMLL